MSGLSYLDNFSTFLSFVQKPSDKTFTVVHANLRRLRKYWNESQFIVQNIGHAVEAFILTQINVHEEALDTFTLRGFKGSFYTRSTNWGGGSDVYVKCVWSTTALNASFTSSKWLAWNIISGTWHIFLVTVYRPPSGRVLGLLEELKGNLELLVLKERLLGEEGYFNIDILQPNKSSVWDYQTIL